MKPCEKAIKTPRGNFKMHTEFSSIIEAENAGWYLWFQHGQYLILTKENSIGAFVDTAN